MRKVFFGMFFGFFLALFLVPFCCAQLAEISSPDGSEDILTNSLTIKGCASPDDGYTFVRWVLELGRYNDNWDFVPIKELKRATSKVGNCDTWTYGNLYSLDLSSYNPGDYVLKLTAFENDPNTGEESYYDYEQEFTYVKTVKLNVVNGLKSKPFSEITIYLEDELGNYDEYYVGTDPDFDDVVGNGNGDTTVCQSTCTLNVPLYFAPKEIRVVALDIGTDYDSWDDDRAYIFIKKYTVGLSSIPINTRNTQQIPAVNNFFNSFEEIIYFGFGHINPDSYDLKYLWLDPYIYDADYVAQPFLMAEADSDVLPIPSIIEGIKYDSPDYTGPVYYGFLYPPFLENYGVPAADASTAIAIGGKSIKRVSDKVELAFTTLWNSKEINPYLVGSDYYSFDSQINKIIYDYHYQEGFQNIPFSHKLAAKINLASIDGSSWDFSWIKKEIDLESSWTIMSVIGRIVNFFGGYKALFVSADGKTLRGTLQDGCDRINPSLKNCGSAEVYTSRLDISHTPNDVAKVTLPNGQVKRISSQVSWTWSCEDVGCPVGDYKVDWLIKDIFVNDELHKTATFNFDGTTFTEKASSFTAGGGSFEEFNVFLRGDANSDGKFDIGDAAFVLNYLFRPNSEIPTCLKATDANDDGFIDISDAVRMLFVITAGHQMPAPFPNAGFDTTPDDLSC